MKNKKIFVLSLIISIFLISSIFLTVAVSNKVCEKRIEFYYNPSCSHCKEVAPLVQQMQKEYTNWKFYYYDITKGSYPDITGVPTIKIYPGDKLQSYQRAKFETSPGVSVTTTANSNNNREIILQGSYEIPKYLKCELQEMSTLECPTHINLIRNSYFIEE